MRFNSLLCFLVHYYKVQQREQFAMHLSLRRSLLSFDSTYSIFFPYALFSCDSWLHSDRASHGGRKNFLPQMYLAHDYSTSVESLSWWFSLQQGCAWTGIQVAHFSAAPSSDSGFWQKSWIAYRVKAFFSFFFLFFLKNNFVHLETTENTEK